MSCALEMCFETTFQWLSMLSPKDTFKTLNFFEFYLKICNSILLCANCIEKVNRVGELTDWTLKTKMEYLKFLFPNPKYGSNFIKV